MKTPQILTGQQAIDQFGLNALIECRVAVTTELNGLGHSVMQIGVIADPDSCQIDEDDTGVLWVEYQGADDWYLYSIPADEQFVLLDDKNQPAQSNAVLANSIAELTRKNSELAAEIENILKGDLTPEQYHRLMQSEFFANVKAHAINKHTQSLVKSIMAVPVPTENEYANTRMRDVLVNVINRANQLRQQAKAGA